MKSFLKRLYLNTIAGKFIIGIALKIYYKYSIYIINEKNFIKKRFKKKIGAFPNLDNPTTFNEKITWLKLNHRRPLHTTCADKLAVREYVKEKIGDKYLIPLIFHSDKVSELKPSNFPDYPFIIKTNHDSSGGIIVKNKITANWKLIRKQLTKLLKQNYYYPSKEWQYKNIKPLVIAEKLLMDINDSIPFDYKLHFFNGEFVFVQVDIDRQIDHKRNLYDKDWNFIDVQWIYKNGDHVKRPKNFDKMLSLAKNFASDFCYVRVDLYTLKDEIYFGELTFHSESGCGIFYPSIWDKKFGDMLTLPNKYS